MAAVHVHAPEAVVTVTMSLSEARALVAIGGTVGGSPDGPRGLVGSVLGEELYPGDFGPWQTALDDLGAVYDAERGKAVYIEYATK